jgi:hypothetical protein
MHCVVWTYAVPAGLTKAKSDELFAENAPRYFKVPGLVRKHFGYSEDGKTVVGIYVWQSRRAAEEFYTPQWIAGVTSRWGVAPTRTDYEIPLTVESADGTVVNEARSAGAAT